MLLLTFLAKARGKKEVRVDGLAVRLIYKKIRVDHGDPQSDGRCCPPRRTHCYTDRTVVVVRRGGPIVVWTTMRSPTLGLAADALPRRCVRCSHFFFIFFEKKVA
jgi:hypothetical protein